MSTFTEWNGPNCNSGVKTSDVVSLINAYKDVLDKFNNYQPLLNFDKEPKLNSPNPVESGGVFDAIKNAVYDLEAKLNDYLKTADADKKYMKKGELDGEYVSESYVLDALKAYLKISDLSEQDVIKDIQSDIESIGYVLAEGKTSIETGILKATKYIEGCIHALNELRFEDAAVPAYAGGRDSKGVFYILGMVDIDRSGTAYVKYKNDLPFSAVVDFAATFDKKDGYKGALTVLTNASLHGLKFMLVYGSDSKNEEHHAYLAIQASDWLAGSSGMFNSIEFDIGGINIAPVGTEHFVKNNGECEKFAECSGDAGFNSNMTVLGDIVTDRIYDSHGRRIVEIVEKEVSDADSASVLVIGDKKYDHVMFDKRPSMVVQGSDGSSVDSPFMTLKDIDVTTLPVGVILRWGKYHDEQIPVYDEDGNPVIVEDGIPNPLQKDGEEAWEVVHVLDSVPPTFLPCDGSDFDTSKYKELAAIYPDGKLPLEDFSIIHAETIIAEADVEYSDILTDEYFNKRIDNIDARLNARDKVYTYEEYLEARKIPEGEPGYIPAGAHVVITDMDNLLNAEDEQ